jgi:hypothetical protein
VGLVLMYFIYVNVNEIYLGRLNIVCCILGEGNFCSHPNWDPPCSVFVWAVIREGVNWGKIPRSVKGFNDNFLLERGNKKDSVLFFLFGDAFNRNDWIFNQKLISSPRAIVFRLILFL